MLDSVERESRKLVYCDLGLIDYKDAWDLQKSIHQLRTENKIDDILLLLEHPHTYTLGKTADKQNLVGDKNIWMKIKFQFMISIEEVI